MARETKLTCDICKRPTARIVGKLQYVPVFAGSRAVHSNYSHHLDVGVCCKDRLFKSFNFTKRKTQAEYQQSRRAS